MCLIRFLKKNNTDDHTCGLYGEIVILFTKKYVVFLVAFLVLISWAGKVRANVPDPTAQLKPFLEKIVNELKKTDFRDDPSCRQCRRIIDIASEHFDFHEMSKRVLGKQWRKLTQEQKDQFVNLFTRLLQYAYIGKVEDYVDKEIKFGRQRIKGNRAEVQTQLIDGNKAIPVSYIMILKGDKWMAYDIVVEGVSLVRNYMEQFRSILRSEKFSGLIDRMESKILELEAEKNRKMNADGKEEHQPSAQG
jgi:phospholipid transport system substrate-binding protein